jgi:hypothetical protein
MEGTFSDDFLEKLARIIWADSEQEDTDDRAQLGDGPRLADSMLERLDVLYYDLTVSLAGVMQFLAVQDGDGNIEALDDERLISLVRAAVHAIEGWSEYEETQLTLPEPKTPLQAALKAHYQIERKILDLQAETLSSISSDDDSEEEP